MALSWSLSTSHLNDVVTSRRSWLSTHLAQDPEKQIGSEGGAGWSPSSPTVGPRSPAALCLSCHSNGSALTFSAFGLMLHVCHPHLTQISLVASPNLESDREGSSGKPNSSLATLTHPVCFHSAMCLWIPSPCSSRLLCFCVECSFQPCHLAKSYSTFKTLQRHHLLRRVP